MKKDGIKVYTARDMTPKLQHKSIRVTGVIDGEHFCVDVLPYCGEYHWHEIPKSMPEDDEPVQIAIGEYFDNHDIDVGRVGR